MFRHIPSSFAFLSLSSFPSFLSSRLTNLHSPTPHAMFLLINSSASSANPLRLMAPFIVRTLHQFFLFIFFCSFHSLIRCFILTFEVIKAMTVHITAYFAVTPCSLVELHHHFRVISCLHHKG